MLPVQPWKTVISMLSPALRLSHSGKCINVQSIASLRTKSPCRKVSAVRSFHETNSFQSIQSKPRKYFLKNPPEGMTCGPLLSLETIKKKAQAKEPKNDVKLAGEDTYNYFDEIFYDGNEREERKYQKTWIDFPDPVPKRPFFPLVTLPVPPLYKRPKDSRPKTACEWTMKGNIKRFAIPVFSDLPEYARKNDLRQRAKLFEIGNRPNSN